MEYQISLPQTQNTIRILIEYKTYHLNKNVSYK